MKQIPSFIDARTEIEIANTRTGVVTTFTLDDTIKSDVEIKIQELDPPKNPHNSEALTFSDLRIGMTVDVRDAFFMESRYSFMVDGEPMSCCCDSSFKDYGKNNKELGIAPNSLWELPVIRIVGGKFVRTTIHLESVGILPHVLKDGSLRWKPGYYCKEV